MGTWRGTGRRALAVGAGALLIGALGAGPAYAGSDNDDDDYVYVDDSCSDYHYSWYYEHGYDYDEHWDDDHGDHDRWDKDRWDHGKDWHRGDDWKKHWDDKDFYVKDGKVYDKKTNKPVFDLGTGQPISVSDTTSANVTDAAPDSGQADKRAEDAAKQAQEQADEAAKQAQKQADEAAKQAQKRADEAAKQAQEQAEDAAKQAQKQADEAAKETPPKTDSQAGNAGIGKSESTVISPDGSTSKTTVEQNAVVTDLAATDPWDDKGKNHDWDRDKDRDKDRDHGWGDGWWEKGSYTVDVSCYEDKETNHRWYDDRPVGEIDATEVKTVPTGGVDTGN